MLVPEDTKQYSYVCTFIWLQRVGWKYNENKLLKFWPFLQWNQIAYNCHGALLYLSFEKLITKNRNNLKALNRKFRRFICTTNIIESVILKGKIRIRCQKNARSGFSKWPDPDLQPYNQGKEHSWAPLTNSLASANL